MQYVKVIFEISAALPRALPRDYGFGRAPSPHPISVSRALWSCAHTFEKARCLGRLHIHPTIVKQGHRIAFWDAFELEGKGSCCLSGGRGGVGYDKRANLRFLATAPFEVNPTFGLFEIKGSLSHLSLNYFFKPAFYCLCRRQRSPSLLKQG